MQVDEAVEQGLAELTPEQQEQLSKALFPDTHTEKVMVLGKERTLKPLPLKFSREINARLKPFNDKLKQAQQGGDAETTEQELADDLVAVAEILAKRYDFEDVVAGLKEEELTVDEIQAFVVTQVNLQQKNDFLLTPLRFLVGLLQRREIAMVQLQNQFQSIGSGQG